MRRQTTAPAHSHGYGGQEDWVGNRSQRRRRGECSCRYPAQGYSRTAAWVQCLSIQDQGPHA